MLAAPRVKRFVLWFLAIFLLYAIFKSPDQAAAMVGGAFDGISALISAIGRFFDALLAR